MWFATENGLSKYDGYTFENYKFRPDSSFLISHNYIHTIFEDTEKNLWIGTENGLNKYDRSNNSFLYFPKADTNNKYAVINIVEDDSGKFLFTMDGTVETFDRKNMNYIENISELNSCIIKNNLMPNRVCQSSFFPDKLWLPSSNKGLWIFDLKTGKMINVNLDLNGYESNNPSIYNILESKNIPGLLLVVCDLYLRTNETILPEISLYPLLKKNVRLVVLDGMTIFEDNRGNFWIGTRTGLLKFNYDKKSFTKFTSDINNPYSLGNNQINHINDDRTGLIWVGTDGGGVNKFDPKYIRFSNFDETLYNNLPNNTSVWSILEDRNKNIWLGIKDGLIKYNFRNKNIVKYTNKPGAPESLGNNFVRAIFEDSKGTIWVGTEGGGISRYNPSTDSFTRFLNDPEDPGSISGNKIRSIFEDKSGSLWIGTYGDGLNKYDRKYGQFSSYKITEKYPDRYEEDFIWSITEGDSGSLWLATSRGFVKFDKQKYESTSYFIESYHHRSIGQQRTRCIHKDKAGNLWISTYGGGLNKFDLKTKIFSRYTKTDGLPTNVIFGILEDDSGNLWLSTKKGISKFSPYSNSGIKVKNYNFSDGLQNDEFNEGAYFKGSDGKMYFGGVNGINAFYNEEIVDNPFPPKIVLTDFKIFNNSVSHGKNAPIKKHINEAKEIVLSYKQNFFSFEFAALDYVSSEKNQYSYKMDNFDPEWIVCGTKRYASYTNLSPGEYTFRAKAANSSGVWNEEGISVKVTIRPPFWGTIRFRLAAFILLAGLVYSTFRLRIKAIEKQSKKLELTVDKRTRQLNREREAISQINVNLQNEIKEREKTEDALRNSEEKHRRLLETMNEGFVILNNKGIVTYVNEKICRLCGYPEEVMLGKYFANGIVKQDRNVLEREWTHRNYGFANQYETYLLTKKRKKIPVILSPKAIFEKGFFMEAYAVITDISERKNLEEKLKLHARNLEKLVEQRTEQMLQSSKLASLGTFASGIAHQKRQYLQTILLNAEMINEDIDIYSRKGLPPEYTNSVKESINQITNAVQAANSLIKSLLGYSKGDLIKTERLSPKEQIEFTLSLIKHSYLKEGIIIIEKLENTPDIKGNPTQIRELVMNLLTNARDAVNSSQRGDKKIEIHLFHENNSISIVIKDNGEGISSEKRKQIFDPFFTTKSPQKGTGIGLSVVSKYVANHNGKIDLISKKGYGATFIISIPVNKEEFNE